MSDSQTSTEKISVDSLRQLTFLTGVDDRFLREIAESSKLVRFASGTIIFTEFQQALDCYLIVEGSVVLEICGTSTGCTAIQTVGRGELFGWSTILGNPELTMTARAVEPTVAIEISGEKVRSMCESDHEFGYQIMRSTAIMLSRRLTATRLLLMDVYREGRGM